MLDRPQHLHTTMIRAFTQRRMITLLYMVLYHCYFYTKY